MPVFDGDGSNGGTHPRSRRLKGIGHHGGHPARLPAIDIPSGRLVGPRVVQAAAAPEQPPRAVGEPGVRLVHRHGVVEWAAENCEPVAHVADHRVGEVGGARFDETDGGPRIEKPGGDDTARRSAAHHDDVVCFRRHYSAYFLSPIARSRGRMCCSIFSRPSSGSRKQITMCSTPTS